MESFELRPMADADDRHTFAFDQQLHELYLALGIERCSCFIEHDNVGFV